MNPLAQSEASDVGKLCKIQALFRGKRSRQVHVERAKRGEAIICPFVRSTPRVVDAMIKGACISEADVVYDLGCGEGDILVHVLQKTGARCFGFEIDAVLVETCRRRCRNLGVADDRVNIQLQDIVDIDVSSATVVCLFLVPSCLEVLSTKFKEQCAPGTRICCFKYPLPAKDGWVPASVFEVDEVLKGGRDATLVDFVFCYEKA